MIRSMTRLARAVRVLTTAVALAVIVLGLSVTAWNRGPAHPAGAVLLAAAHASADSMAGMSMGKTCNHHAELHITRTADGQVMTRAHVTITLVNNDTHTVIHLPIMTMAGAEGKRDFHYGNNVYAPPGSYTVFVRVNNVRTAFSVRLA